MKSESFKYKGNAKPVELTEELKQAVIDCIQSKFEIEANKQFWEFMQGKESPRYTFDGVYNLHGDPITEKDVYGQTHEK